MRLSAIAVTLAVALVAPALARADDLSLETVIRLALTRNERARIADAQVESAEADVTRARAGFLPTVTLSASETLRPYTVTRNGETVVGSNSATGAITLSQPLLDVTAFPLYAAAKHDREAARYAASNDKRELAFDAARAFFLTLAQEQVLEAALRRLERAQASLLSTKAQAAAQIVSSNDVTRAELERASAARSLAAAQGDAGRAKVELAYLINAPVGGRLKPPERAITSTASTRNVPALVARAVAQRPDLAAARETAASARASADEPGLRFAPTVNLVGQVRASNTPFAGNRTTDATLTLNLGWTLWDAGRRGADSDARKAAVTIADLQAKAQQRRVAADVQAAAVALDSAEAARSVAGEAAVAARKGAEESAVLYREGLARAIELVDANLKRFEAEVDLAQADLDVAQAELDLRAALGLFPVDEKR